MIYKSITTEFIISAIDKVKEKYDILDTDLKTTTIEFFKNLTNQDIDYDFESIKNLHIDFFGETKLFEEGMKDLIPTKEGIFYLYICENFFCIVPNDKNDSIISLISKDIEDINCTIQKYNSELEQLKEVKEGKRYKESLLKHYLKKLENAKEQILQFVKDKLEISVKKNKYKPILLNIFDWGMYHYHYFPETYKKEYLSSGLFHKLAEHSLHNFIGLIQLYKEKGDDIFWDEYKKQVDLIDLINDVKLLLKCHHRLSERKDFIEQVLQLLSDGTLELFCNIMPLQIEGLVYDLCLEFDLKESDLFTSSITDKVEILRKKDFLDDSYYEYFAFVFPIIRNRVAHGKKIEKNFEHLSWELLLDFKSICKLFSSTELPINAKLSLIKIADKSRSLDNLLSLHEVFKFQIDTFYSYEFNLIEELKNDLANKLTEENFNNAFDLKSLTDEEKHKIKDRIIAIKDLDINALVCKKILSILNVEKKKI